ncbi:DUF4386 domain-containing protein [Spirochaeta lutea]|uniref:DUF4386 domain-containing protein n=1 Tax=Spirochaeta lutea TaxID=1480694 RepID=A0A098QWM4_9SPIO|nr:DUF4386 domain-containing protein [Spirochaeta lutea]KGE70857.1 hypothetical protein DC28_15430 [Spirochaeta lutea]
MTGVLYFLGTVFGVLSVGIGGEVLTSITSSKPMEGVDMLGLVAANSSQLTLAAFFTIMMGISLVAMTVFLYPVIRKDSQELATGMVIFRGSLEGTGYILSTIAILTFVILGNEHAAVGAGSTELPYIGNALYRVIDLMSPIHSLMFLIGATCLYVSFYRTKLIPRWLSIWGLIGVVPYFAYAFLHFFHLDTGFGIYLQMVLAPQELVMGAWLVIKGFNQEALQGLMAN